LEPTNKSLKDRPDALFGEKRKTQHKCSRALSAMMMMMTHRQRDQLSAERNGTRSSRKIDTKPLNHLSSAEAALCVTLQRQRKKKTFLQLLRGEVGMFY
jgi:hypothetical protein